MINNQFLLYKTLDAYREDVQNIKPTSIVFVVEDGTVRTHGFVFGGNSIDPEELTDYVRKDEIQSYIPSSDEPDFDITQYVRKDEIAQYVPQQPITGDNKKHVILTRAQYNALDEYDEDTIYFILGTAEESLDYANNQFGGRFPLYFGSDRLGQTFPITLN